MQTTIVIPCYNEADRIDKTAFRSFLDSHPDIALLFVNDGSNDGTLALLKTFSQEDDRMSYLSLPTNRGKAEAVRQGMLHTAEHSGSDYIAYWDADLATPLDEIDRFLTVAADGEYDMVTGLRLLRLGADIRRRPLRHYLGRCFATVASWLLKLPVYDTQCGAKLFRSGIVPVLFYEPFVTQWLFDVELFARYTTIYNHKAAMTKICECPLRSWKDVGGSKLKTTDFLRAPRELRRIKRKYRL